MELLGSYKKTCALDIIYKNVDIMSDSQSVQTASNHSKLSLELSTELPTFLVPTNLALRNGLDGCQSEIDGDCYHADDSDCLSVQFWLVAKDDCKDNASQITCCARAARDDT